MNDSYPKTNIQFVNLLIFYYLSEESDFNHWINYCKTQNTQNSILKVFNFNCCTYISMIYDQFIWPLLWWYNWKVGCLKFFKTGFLNRTLSIYLDVSSIQIPSVPETSPVLKWCGFLMTSNQILVKRGPDLRFIIEANHKPLVSTSNSRWIK